MSSYDERARLTAHRNLLPKSMGGKGQAVALIKAGHAAYNPATGFGAPLAPEQFAACGLELRYQAHEVDGTFIKAGDRKFMLSALRPDGGVLDMPRVGFQLIYADGRAWRIEDVDAFQPAGLMIYAYLQLRKA